MDKGRPVAVRGIPSRCMTRLGLVRPMGAPGLSDGPGRGGRWYRRSCDYCVDRARADAAHLARCPAARCGVAPGRRSTPALNPENWVYFIRQRARPDRITDERLRRRSSSAGLRRGWPRTAARMRIGSTGEVAAYHGVVSNDVTRYIYARTAAGGAVEQTGG